MPVILSSSRAPDQVFRLGRPAFLVAFSASQGYIVREFLNDAASTMAAKQSNSPDARFKGLTLLRRSQTLYADSPDKARLESFRNLYSRRDYWVEFDCPEFTTLCPVTGQPDFGHITIRYIPDKLCMESKALKLYLFAFRNHRTFHEEAVNRILDDVLKAIRPRKALVKGVFNPRGGIAITVEAAYPR